MNRPMLLNLVFVLFLSLASAANATEFFVAPHGDDRAAGTAAQPFATPTRAMAAVRALVAAGLKSDVRVIFRGGTYTLAAPLVFSAADSGSERHSITYTAASGETVVWSGGRAITNWQRGEGRKWTAELPEVKAGRWFFRQLIVNDQRAVRARWPNEDGALHIATVANGVKTFTFDRPLPPESLARPPHTPSPLHAQGQLDPPPQKQFPSRDYRLTDVAGKVVKEIIS